MEFRLLGPLEVVEDGRVLHLGGPKRRALLALLLLHAGRVVSTERVIDDLWGESPPATVAKTLQTHVSRLRKDLGAHRLITRSPGYAVQVEPSELDLARFERLVSEARQSAPGEAAQRLREALALWRGPPLADLAYEPFVQAEIGRLEELRLATLEERINADLRLGRHAELVGELEALCAEHPQRERLRGQLMIALYRSGRQAEALESYRAARSALVEELGIEPGRPLRELHQAILEQDARLDLAAEIEALEAPEPEAGPPRTVFVGRDRELAELTGGLDDALGGRGRLFLVAGEPGIGKSRLADELAARARVRGARVLVGRCWEAGGAPAYWPWVQALRAHLREVDTGTLRAQLGGGGATIAQIAPELRERFPDLPEPAPLEPEGARFRLFDATAEFLRRAAQDHPMVLVIDDLHAADAPSLLLLRFFARELHRARILVLAAYRDVDPTPAGPLVAALAELTREPVTRRLSLGGLSEREIEEYVEATASEIASPDLVTALSEQAEGNPLFVGETVRLLAVEGVEPRGRARPLLAIPQSVRDVIARRLAHLPEQCHRLLVLASVLGREFGLDALARMGRIDEDELLDLLDAAISARVLSDVPGAPGRLRFAHVLIRDTLYEGQTSARRVRLHGLAVETLEALYGDEPGPRLAELAYHSLAGGHLDKGLRYATRAGDRSLALLAYEESARWYETALDALARADRQDEEARCRLLLALGEAHSQAGDTARAKSALLEAASIARRRGLARELARAAAEYGGRIVYARASADEHLLPLLDEGLAAVGDEDPQVRTWLLARLAGALRDEPSRGRREALSAEAVELAQRTGDSAALAYALDGRAIAIIAPDTVAEVAAVGLELREVAARIGDRERVVHGHMHRFGPLLMLGQLEEAVVELDAAWSVAQELRQPAHLWDVGAAKAMLAIACGRLGEGEQLAEQALALGERTEPAMTIPVYRLQRYTLCDFRGSLEAVEPAIRDLAAEHPARPVFRCVLAHCHARLGRRGEAAEALDDLAASAFSVLPFDQEWLLGVSLLAETIWILGEADRALTAYELLVPWAHLNVVDQCEAMMGSASRYLALLATMLERWEDAEAHFEAAVAMNARMRARPWLAHTLHDYAAMLGARAQPHDLDRARNLLADARTIYNELGMEERG
jgi:DNA-binding SARP family transcriptional activator